MEKHNKRLAQQQSEHRRRRYKYHARKPQAPVYAIYEERIAPKEIIYELPDEPEKLKIPLQFASDELATPRRMINQPPRTIALQRESGKLASNKRVASGRMTSQFPRSTIPHQEPVIPISENTKFLHREGTTPYKEQKGSTMRDVIRVIRRLRNLFVGISAKSCIICMAFFVTALYIMFRLVNFILLLFFVYVNPIYTILGIAASIVVIHEYVKNLDRRKCE